MAVVLWLGACAGQSAAQPVHARRGRRSRRRSRRRPGPRRSALHRSALSETAVALVVHRAGAQQPGRAERSGAPPIGVVDGAREFWEGHPAAIPDSWLTGPFQVAPIDGDGGQLAGGVGVFVPQSWQQLLDRRMALLSRCCCSLPARASPAGSSSGGLRRRLRDLERRGAALRRRRLHGSCGRSRRRRTGGARGGVQPDGERPGGRGITSSRSPIARAGCCSPTCRTS